MIIISPNQTFPNSINKSVRNNQEPVTQPSPAGDREQRVNSQNQTLRVIRVASDGAQVAEFGRRGQTNSRGQSSLFQDPASQYLNNQQLLQREEIDGIIGIDLFA